MNSNVTQDQFESEMLLLIKVLEQLRRLGLQQAESLIRQRGIAEARELARIRAREGAEAPATLEQAETLLAAGGKSAQMRADMSAADFASRFKPDKMSAIGRVLAKGGLPAADHRLRVATDRGAVIADAVVDASGMFMIEMPRSEFDRRAERTSQLHITILNTKSTKVRQEQFPFVPGQNVLVWNFDLSSEAPNQKRPRAGPGGLGNDGELWPVG